ncbi:xanthine dehydrogenase family protein subunit M [Streptomyces sp. NPDC047108]|uniref:FAD binding domain-containing protein n=1 Tax=Streptomyces sp. NPDC047108 TaxID=3155025 RepID=UPI0033FBA09F
MTYPEYRVVRSAHEAVTAAVESPTAVFMSGGTHLVDHMKLGIERPGLIVDISRLPYDTVEDLPAGGLRIGAMIRSADLAAHRLVRQRFPMVAQALLAGASGQVRNMASVGGNLLQRTRCVYFRDVSTPCNKRKPGSGCPAAEGYDRHNAVLGTESACLAVCPSDLAVALCALDATLRIHGPDGVRTIPVTRLHRLPGENPGRDTVLEHGELITAIDLPPPPDGSRSLFHKVRERASFAFALVSVAAVLGTRDGRVADVRIALGGLAHKPWRATRAENLLQDRPATDDRFRAAADAELADARTGTGNAYKVPMARNTLVSTLRTLARGQTV